MYDSEIDDGRMAANNPGGQTAEIMSLQNDETQTTESVNESQIVAQFLKYTAKGKK